MNERRIILSLIIPETLDNKIPIRQKTTAQQKPQTNNKNTITHSDVKRRNIQTCIR